MIATTRMLTLSTLLAMLVGLLLVDQAGAEGRFRPRQYSEAVRQSHRDSCKGGGGTSFETVYHYEFGSNVPTSVTTTCHGGTKDGITCEIVTTSQCSLPLLPGDETGPFGGLSSDAVIEEFDASSSSETADPAGDVLATPEAGAAPRTVVGTIRSTVVQADDDEQP